MSVSLYGSGQTVIQAVSSTLTGTFTMSGQTQTAITGLSATITPQSTTSSILIIVTIGGYSQGTGQGRFILTRGGTNIGIGAAGSGQLQSSFVISGPSSGAPMVTGGISYLDSPSSTSSLTYGVTVSSNDAGAAIYINRSVTDSGSTSYQRTISNITLLEISGS